MSVVVNIVYTGKGDSARKYAEEMISTGIAQRVRDEEGCLRYEFYYPAEDPNSVLLIDEFRDQKAIDFHHKTEMMKEIAELRTKYGLHMKVKRFIPAS